MNKGIIMEVKKNYAIALNDEGIMNRVRLKDNMKAGQKIYYFEDDILNSTFNNAHRYNGFMKAFGSIAALFLIVFTFFHVMKPQEAYAVVSLDINPSIQIEVDSNQKIIKVEGVNDDGKNIDFSDIKDISFESGIQKVKDKLVEKNYLDTNKDVLVGYAFVKNGDNSDYKEDLKDAIDSTFDTEEVTYVQGDKKDVDEAKTQGISLGRYEASKVVNQEIKDNINKASVKEITASIKDKEDDSQWKAQDEKENNSQDTNTKPEVKNDKPVTEKSTTEKPANASSDNTQTAIGSGKDKDAANKPEKDNVLEVQPDEQPQDNSNSSTAASSKDNNSISVTPNNGAIENNTTSGKIKDDSNKAVTPEPSKSASNSGDKNTKN